MCKDKINGEFKKYTTLSDIRNYLSKYFNDKLCESFFTDESNHTYYLEDFMFLKHNMILNPFRDSMVNIFTHASFDKFLQNKLPKLAEEFCSGQIQSFNTHNFRHTINTLLDDGGLTDLLQTEWFGRENPRDTKAYQHASMEQKALGVIELLKNNKLKGNIKKQLDIMEKY